MRLYCLPVIGILGILPALAADQVIAGGTAVNDLLKAVEFERQGRAADAKLLLLKVVHQLEPNPAGAEVALGVALNDLATVSQLEGRFEESESRYLRAIRVLESQRDEAARAAWAYSNFNLARLYLETGRLPLAARLPLPSALEALPENESRTRARATLAGLAAMRKDYDTAESEYLAILSFWRSPARERASDLEIASVLNNLSVVSIWQGRTERALSRIAESSRILNALDSVSDPAAARVIATTGIVCTLLKRYDDGALFLSRATALVRKRYGEAHPLTLAIELSYAEALRKGGRKQEAKEVSRMAEEGRKAMRGSADFHTVDYRDLLSLSLNSAR